MALVVAAAAVLWWRPRRERSGGAAARGLPGRVVVALAFSIPFAVSGRWGLLGVGFNNDLGLHLAWAEWLRSGFGPAPKPATRWGRMRWRRRSRRCRGSASARPSSARSSRSASSPRSAALTVLDDLGPARRTLAATLVAIPFLGASYFAQGAFKETAEALFVLAFALWLHTLDRDRRRPTGRYVAQLGFGPSAVGRRCWGRGLLLLQLCGACLAGVDLRALGADRAGDAAGALAAPLVGDLRQPATLLTIGVLGALAVLTVVGPYAFIHGFNRVAGTNTYGPVSPVEALGIWPTSNYRLNAVGGAQLTGLATAIGGRWRSCSAASGGCGGASSPCRSRSAPAPSSTSPRSPAAASTPRPRP